MANPYIHTKLLHISPNSWKEGPNPPFSHNIDLVNINKQNLSAFQGSQTSAIVKCVSRHGKDISRKAN